MKYSIISEALSSDKPFNLSGSFNRVFSDYNNTCIFSVLPDKKIQLQSLAKQVSTNKQEEAKVRKRSFELNVSEEIDWARLKYLWCDQNQWILIFSAPLRLYYVVEKYKSLLPIKLQEEINLTTMECYVTYPELYIYGSQEGSTQHTIYQINLTTFDIKPIKPTKQNGPQNKINPWCFFSDSRLYITGGTSKKNKETDSLMWTYAIDNGYWFALELSSDGPPLDSTAINCEYENGKVFCLCNERLYLVQLYQSRARQLEGWDQLIKAEQLSLIRGIFVSNGWIYFQSQQSLYPTKFKISKVKEQS